jgi:hypothetical protein
VDSLEATNIGAITELEAKEVARVALITLAKLDGKGRGELGYLQY